jgi:hypothetical protein
MRQRARELFAGGKTLAQVRAQLMVENGGAAPSQKWLSECKRGVRVPRSTATPGERAVPTPEGMPDDMLDGLPEGFDPMAMLREVHEQISAYTTALAEAGDSASPADRATLLRLKLQAVALAAKISPPPPPDPTAQPDMIAAAKLGRERLQAAAAKWFGRKMR